MEISAAIPEPVPRDSRWPDGSGPRVLVVDDDPAIRLLCSANLALEGLVVVEAADGRLALEHAHNDCPDLIVTDVTMPGLDGFELAEALRGDVRTSRVPVIFLTGETALSNAVRARKLGALAYLTKPFDPAALVSLVVTALAGVASVATTESD